MLATNAIAQTPPSMLSRANRVLVVEDEELIRDMVASALRDEGYEVTTAADGATALRLLQLNMAATTDCDYDLIILDLMLPQFNGLDLCRLLRQRQNPVPILMLSAKASEADRVTGLELGADDYLTKPFSLRELVARCRAMSRRMQFGQVPSQERLQYEELVLYPQECRVTVRGEEVNLSPKEFRLLELFMRHPRRVWSREQLLEKIWGIDFIGDSKTVDVHIRWLREKVEVDPSKPVYIVTIRGFGYRLG
ncbi:MAG: response regulator transcription factor [Cyanobacteria bacterium P01_C01_bin.89]